MRYVDLPSDVQTPRVASVDALRGLNMFWIMGFDGAMVALAQMSDGKGPLVHRAGGFLSTQFQHVAWEGLRFYDLIFPLFVFLTGVSIVLSLPRLVAREGRAKAHLRVLRRSLLLYVLGLIAYGGISGHWGDIRLLGVLQRIALCYFFTSLMFLNFNLRGLVAALVVLLSWLLGAPDLRPGTGNRRGFVWRRHQSRPTGSITTICRADCGTSPATLRACSARCRRSAPVCSAFLPACCCAMIASASSKRHCG